MKRQISFAFVLALTLVGGSAFARDNGPIGPAGCGLGYVLLGGKELQVLVATVNATSGNQTFGITTGTLECGGGFREMAMLNYIQNNKQSLENDIARGAGESVAALAQIAGCSSETEFGAALKNSYQEIFPTAETSTVQITTSIKKVIGDTPQLKTSCAPLS